ncbi:MAG: 2-amino-3,7-dideoxy-D-threo-hept-6-ulosonate synthase [Desulfobacteraceae bacterium]|jgi:predicted phospho-2-dehydro-3-deoxyheptonate aldolase
MNGKDFRLARLIRPNTGKICLVAIDHGTTMGPITGLQDASSLIHQLVAGHADAIILHKGLLRLVHNYPGLACGKFVMHLSASTALSRDHNEKILVSSVEEAILMGADAVSIHVNIGTDFDANMIKDLGKVSAECLKWGMPLIAMVFSRKEEGKTPIQIAHAARLGQELGADIVKVDYPGSKEGIATVLDGIQIPLVIAGGEKEEKPQTVLQMIHDAITAGACGVCMGRNIFQHKHPEFLTHLISQLVHGELTIQECLTSVETSPCSHHFSF